jgi:hypothetical protein
MDVKEGIQIARVTEPQAEMPLVCLDVTVDRRETARDAACRARNGPVLALCKGAWRRRQRDVREDGVVTRQPCLGRN